MPSIYFFRVNQRATVGDAGPASTPFNARGRVQAFLSHMAPGGTGEKADDLNIAHVHWYSFVPNDQPSIDPVLGCPVFGKRLVSNDPEGNMCLVEQLLPCKLACLPYQHGARSQVVVLSRFADSMHCNAMLPAIGVNT